MFAGMKTRLGTRLLRSVDVSIEFATLGEYRLASAREPALECELRPPRHRPHEVPRGPVRVGVRPATAAARSMRRCGTDAGAAARARSCAVAE
jgi:hypothetical protein